jgi:hypothetical protein
MIWGSASAVAALAAGGGVWALVNQGPASAAPFFLIFVIAAFAGWYVGGVAERTARHLSTAEARLRAAAEALPDGLVVFDRHDRIAFYNTRFPELMTEALSAGSVCQSKSVSIALWVGLGLVPAQGNHGPRLYWAPQVT